MPAPRGECRRAKEKQGFGYGELAFSRPRGLRSDRNGKAKLSPVERLDTAQTARPKETARSALRQTSIVLDEPEEAIPPKEVLVRDADLLEAWSRGETLIIDDEVDVEPEGDLRPLASMCRAKDNLIDESFNETVSLLEQEALQDEISLKEFKKEELEEVLELLEEPPGLKPLVPATVEEVRPRAKLVGKDHQVARLRSRPQLVPAVEKKAGETAQGEKRKVGEVSNDALYMPPHKKKRGLELAEWKEIKAEWHRKLEEDAQGPRKQKMEPNIRALARRFEATLENPACCLNPLQRDESVEVSEDGLRAECEPSTGRNVSGGVKGLPLIAGGRYQYEVELQCDCSVTIGWSPALALPSFVDSGSAARRMLGYSSEGKLIGEGCFLEVPTFGRPGDVVGALLAWHEGWCGPRISFMLNGRKLGMAFDLSEGIYTPPLQPHICQGQGHPFRILLRGASQEAPLRFPMPGYRPLGNVLEEHFSPFSRAVDLATSIEEQKPPAAARRLIHSSLGLALPLPHLAQERSLGRKARTVTRQDSPD